MFVTQAYRDLIAELSQELPRWSPDVADVKLDPLDLGVVMAEFGKPGQFIADALEAVDAKSDQDGYDRLAIRAQSPSLTLAIQGCGLAVLTAVQNYAAQTVLRDVECWRDAEPRPGRRESPEGIRGVSSLFASRNGVL